MKEAFTSYYDKNETLLCNSILVHLVFKDCNHFCFKLLLEFTILVFPFHKTFHHTVIMITVLAMCQTSSFFCST
jgi:hypothetical protein